ncbi:MAG: hypothetical protein V3W34_03660 [Phycisphaerae bacterium]
MRQLALRNRPNTAAVCLAFAFLVSGWQPCLSQSTQVADDEVLSLVERLGDGSFKTREEATIRLLEIGPPATRALKQAVAGNDYEIAIRARDLLEVFEHLLFSGVTIELSGSRTVFDWSDSVALTVRLENTGSHVARLPFELILPSVDKRSARLRQFTSLLDLSEYLVVEGPGGRAVRLYVDDINEDPALVAAVNDRVEQPPVDEIPPGETVRYRVDEFNRGWARYRLLEAGDYQLQVVYQPQWDDDELVRSGVGRVASNRLKLAVGKPAPLCVRRAVAPANLKLSRQGDAMVAALTNQLDLPVWVNLNLTVERGAPFARTRWFVDCGEQRHMLRASRLLHHPREPFSRDRIIQVMPGDTIELARLSYETLADEARGCQVTFTYSNITNITWQRANSPGPAAGVKAGKGREEPLPYRMLVATLTSDGRQVQTSE